MGYKNSLIKTQSNKVNFQEKDLENIYSARTFCLYEDIKKIKDLGLAKGGSLENAVVVKGNEVFNGKGLRSKNEFVNHKILDLVGDFMLAGKRVIGSINCIRGGHSLTNDFLRQVLSDKNNFTTIKIKTLIKYKENLPCSKRTCCKRLSFNIILRFVFFLLLIDICVEF